MSAIDKALRFPDGFLWGAATSHFQIEGHPKEIGARLSDWAHWTKQQGRINDNSHADQACEFYFRFKEDLAIVKELNLNAFRLSLNWSALINDDGTLDQDQVEYYRRLLTSLKEDGVTTFVTLFHFCLPDALSSQGGWLNEATAHAFGRFAGLIARALDGLVDYWVTINEPLAYVYHGFISGFWPPGERGSYISAFTAIRNFLLGHSLAYDAIKQCADRPISFTCHWRPFLPKNKFNPLDHMVRFYRDYVFNHIFPSSVDSGIFQFPVPICFNEHVARLQGEIKGLKGKQDFLAINYYTRELSLFKPSWPVNLFGEISPEIELAVNDMGWEVYPQGLYDLLTRDTRRYQVDASGKARPVFITENGYANMFAPDLTDGDWSLEDEQRVSYMRAHLEQLHRAIKSGIDVRGYLYWSLLDNFEWAEGLSARFGLVRVSYPTQERFKRNSARVYEEIARNNALLL